ncbi:MAG: hypothetical protein HQM14_21450 [SAR324 cluster bacterium]|nr:hypothetical protein [SAR324 cluster bacterium]
MKCALCREEKSVCKSHIIPEFLYTPLYDDKNHKFMVVSTDPNEFNRNPSQGVYEKLLCRDCETVLGVYESYAKGVLLQKIKEGITSSGKRFVVSGLDYAKVKLFLLSILWRAGITTRPEFSIVKLRKHSEILRQMILDQQPGESYEYGCFLHVPLFKGRVVEDMIFPPTIIRFQNQRGYKFMFGGLFWYFFVSSHTEQLPTELKQKFLSKDGHLSVYKESKHLEKYLNEYAMDLKQGGKIP